MEEFYQLIMNVGFPIFCSIVLLKNNRTLTDKVIELAEKSTKALENNTEALNILSDKIGGEHND